MNKTKIKIRTKLIDLMQWIDTSPQRRRNARLPGHCQICGARLRNPKSLARGIGHRCIRQVPVALILEIPPADPEGTQ